MSYTKYFIDLFLKKICPPGRCDFVPVAREHAVHHSHRFTGSPVTVRMRRGTLVEVGRLRVVISFAVPRASRRPSYLPDLFFFFARLIRMPIDLTVYRAAHLRTLAQRFSVMRSMDR